METFMRLGLKEVSYVIKTLGICTEIPYLHGNININGKLYIYEKKNNEFTILGEDGKSLKVAINYSVEEKFLEDGRHFPIPKHEVFFDYGLDNKEHLTFYKGLYLDGEYEGFENVNRHDLLTNIKTEYKGAKQEKIANFTIELKQIHLNGSEKIYSFNNDNSIIEMHPKNNCAYYLTKDSDLDEEAKKADAVRNSLIDVITNNAIEPLVIELVEREFRQNVFSYKNQKRKKI